MTQAVFAGMGRRIGALLLDLALLVLLVPPLYGYIPLYPPAVFLSLAFAYFAALPLTPLQGTLGKWICGIRLCDRNGRKLSWPRSVARAAATLCWWGMPMLLQYAALTESRVAAAFWLLFFLPWVLAAFMPRRESLFDLIAGSLVVRQRADAQSVAAAEPVKKAGILKVVGTVVPALLVGAVLGTFVDVNRDHNRRARVGYAVEQTQPLREKIEAFRGREQRWPSAAALGVPEWTPYRDGGGYRLKPDGVIEISFSVLPELKGHTVTLRPSAAAPGADVQWRCSSDLAFQRMLPGNCRN